MHKMIFSSVAAVAIAVVAFAYSGKAPAQPKSNSGAQQNSTDNARVADPQRSFALLKTLAGTWQASITTPDQPQTPREEGNGQTTQVTLRVTSRGNAILHEVHDPKVPDDPARYDHPISVVYLDDNQLNLTHYCDSGNRPHMRARNSTDGKTVEFDLVDITGSLRYGHMPKAVFTIIDDKHHTEDWTYAFPDNRTVRFHFDLRRISN